MRTCAACFWFRPSPLARSTEGECMNRPPVVVSMVRIHHNGEQYLETASLRPTVLSGDYCCHFSHPSKSRHRDDAPVTDVDGHTDPTPPGPTRG